MTLLVGSNEMRGAYCDLPAQLDLMYQARAVLAMQPGGSRHTWVTIGVDGTNRWNRGYVHDVVVGPWCGSSNQASWWLFEGSEQWATVYGMQLDCDFDAQIRAVAALRLPHTDGVDCEMLFFLLADCKAHVILDGGDGFTEKSPGAMMCHCCGKNRETVLQRFGGGEMAMASIVGQVRATGVCRGIPAERCIPDCGSHGVLRVAHCGLNGMVKVLREHGLLLRLAAARLTRALEWCSEA